MIFNYNLVIILFCRYYHQQFTDDIWDSLLQKCPNTRRNLNASGGKCTTSRPRGLCSVPLPCFVANLSHPPRNMKTGLPSAYNPGGATSEMRSPARNKEHVCFDYHTIFWLHNYLINYKKKIIQKFVLFHKYKKKKKFFII